MRYLSTILLFIGAVLASCEFPLEGENFVEISENPNVRVEIDFVDLPDTVVVLGDVTVRYKLSFYGSSARAVFLALDNQLHFLGYNSAGTFVVNFDAQKTHTVAELLVVSTSGTESMADNTFRELVLWGERRVFIFERTPPIAQNMTADLTGGKVVLNWNPYPAPNLIGLKIRRSWYPATGSDPVTTDVFLPYNATSYRDSVFLTSRVTYQLVTSNNLAQSAYGNIVSVDGARATLIPFVSTGTTVKMQWKRARFYQNSRGYRITVGPRIVNGIPFGDSIANVNGVPLGGTYAAAFTEWSKGNIEYNENQTVWIGEKMDNLVQVLTDKQGLRTFFATSQGIMKEQGGVRSWLALANNAQTLFYLSDDGQRLYVSNNNLILEINTGSGSMSVVNSYTIPGQAIRDFLPHNGKIYCLVTFTSTVTRLGVFDPVSQTMVQTLNPSASVYTDHLLISPDGEYLLQTGGALVANKIQPDGLVTQTSLIKNADIRNVRACFDGSTGILVFGDMYGATSTQDNHATFSFPALTLTGTPANRPKAAVFDDINELAASEESPGRFVVRDIRSSDVLYQVDVMPAQTGSTAIVSHRWFARNGYVMKF